MGHQNQTKYFKCNVRSRSMQLFYVIRVILLRNLTTGVTSDMFYTHNVNRFIIAFTLVLQKL